MWTVIMLMTFLYTPAYTIAESNPCETFNGTTLIWSKLNNCSKVILRHKSITAIETSQESRYDKLIKLDISDNNLIRLPEDFLFNSVGLEEVHLGNNRLEHLPEMFLINSSSLKILRLEGNPLRKVPESVFHVTLLNLTIDCQCELVSNILMHAGNATKYPKLSAMCQMSSEWMNLKDFYEENCGKQYLALYIVLPILLIGLIIGGVALYMWKWKRSSTSLENKGATDKSPAHVQQRYMSRNTEGIETTLSPHQRQDYENVFVDHHLRATETKSHGYMGNEHKPSTHSSKHTTEEDIYLENDGDQPIYTNTQGIYYNYSEPSCMEGKNKEEDDVYILPDQ